MKKLILTILLALPVWAEESPFPIGAVYSLTGWAASGGSAELAAARLAVDEINLAGGVRGRQLALAVEDTQSDFRKTATAVQKLASIDKVSIILGPNWAEFSEVAAPIAQRKGVLMLTASGYAKDLTKDRPLVFTTLPAHRYFTKALAEEIARRKPKKLLLVKTDNGYAESLSGALTEQLVSLGSPITTTDSFSNAEQDFRASILKAKSAGYDGIIVFLLQDNGLGLYLKQARELGLATPLFSSNSVLYDSGIKGDPTLVNGVTFFNLKTLSTPEFEKKFAAATSVNLIDTAPRAYDNVYLLKDAIERCGFERDAITTCLMNTEYTGMAGRIVFDADRNVVPQVEMSELLVGKDGKFVLYDLANNSSL